MWAAEAQFGTHRTLFTNITDIRDTAIPMISYVIRPLKRCEFKNGKKMMNNVLRRGQNKAALDTVLEEIKRQPVKLATLIRDLKMKNNGFHPAFVHK